jgi:hypothetical protein
MENENTTELVHWHCEKCRIRIAVIDKDESELRLRYKDLVIKLSWSDEPGDNDTLDVLCRRCAWSNILTRKQLKTGAVNRPVEDAQKK